MTENKSFFKEFLVSVTGVLTVLTFFSFILGLPWNELGLWKQTETASAVFYGVSALLFASLATLSIMKDRDVFDAMSSRFFLTFLGFCFVGLVLSPFSESPWRAIHGTMKHGAGVIWYFELLTLSVAMNVMIRKGWDQVYAWSALVSSALILLLYVLPKSSIGVPVAFVEWTGLPGGLAALYLILWKDRPFKDNVFTPSFICGIFLLAATYEISDNRTVLICAIAVFLAFLAQFIPGLRWFVETVFGRVITVTSIAVLGLIAVYFSGPLIEKFDMRKPPQTAEMGSVLSDNPKDRYAFDQGGIGTIWSRSYLVRVLIDDLIETPSALITGHGYGGYEAAYERHSRDLPGRNFLQPVPSASRTYWDGHHKADFHSHNMTAEILFSVGVFGLAFWLLAFALMAAASKRGFYITLALTVYGTFWFPINHATAFIALAFTLGMGTLTVSSSRRSYLINGLAPLGYAVSIGLLFFTFMFGQLIRLETYERHFYQIKPRTDLASCGLYKINFFPENEVTWSLYTILTRAVAASSKPAQLVYDNSSLFTAYSCLMRHYSDKKPDIVTLVLSLKERGQIVPLGTMTYGALTQDILSWGADIDKLLTVAPRRTEFLAPYITTLATRSGKSAMMEINRYLPRLADNDPIKEYLLYQRALLLKDDVGQKEHMQKSVDLGFANLWIVSPEMVKELELK